MVAASTTSSAASTTTAKGTLAYFASVGNLTKGPANATPWDALKAIGLETAGVIVLSVVAGVSSNGANAALALLVLLWILALVTNPLAA